MYSARKLLIALFASALLALFSVAFAQTAYVTEDTKLYKKADTLSKYMRIDEGEKVDLIDTGNGFAKVKWSNKTGFILKKNVSALKSVNKVMFINHSEEMRKTFPSGTVITKLEKNDMVTVTGKCGDWAWVKFEDNEGFVRTERLSSELIDDDVDTFYAASKTVTVYSKASKSSKAIGKFELGDEITSVGESGKYYKVKYRSGVGYVRKSKCVKYKSEVPVFKTMTAYVTADTAAIYESASTSSKVKIFLTADALVTVRAYNATWAYVEITDAKGFMRMGNLAKLKGDPGTSSAKPATGTASEADWYTSGIKTRFYIGKSAKITDIITGTAFKIKRCGGKDHADIETETRSDTEAFNSMKGRGSMERRPVFLTVDNKNYAASIYGGVHECSNSKNDHNGMNGVFCVHLTNSKVHKSGQVDPEHQKMIKIAAKIKL